MIKKMKKDDKKRRKKEDPEKEKSFLKLGIKKGNFINFIKDLPKNMTINENLKQMQLLMQQIMHVQVAVAQMYQLHLIIIVSIHSAAGNKLNFNDRKIIKKNVQLLSKIN